MDIFYGFDLGDAESAVAKIGDDTQALPEIVPLHDEKSFVTAYAEMGDGRIQIGEQACYAANAVKRKLRFKSHFLENASSAEDIRCFASGVLATLRENGELTGDACVYIGCPAGWNKNEREQYRAVFERSGYPPAKIISESRAAMVSACQSRHLQVGYDILSKPVLVVDIGSSTTDFAYIMKGREVAMRTAGEVKLGGGAMDELLLDGAVAASPHAEGLRQAFRESEPWRTYCEFVARRLKERYYSDIDWWEAHGCTESVMVRYDRPLRLVLRMDRETADRLVAMPSRRLGGRSFRSVFMDALKAVRAQIPGNGPELIFLTGGVSKLPWIRGWCMEVFRDAVVICGNEPEFSVARGLAWSGRIDDELRKFRAELEELKAGRTVEKLVSERIGALYKDVVDVLVDPILEEAALPVFARWRSGEIRRLLDTDGALQSAITEWLQSDAARKLLMKPVTVWMKKTAEALEAYTVPICIRHNVPYTALSLSAWLDASEMDIRLEARNMFAVHELMLMIDGIVSILVGLVCGGSGVAVIASGPEGILAGVLLSLFVLVLGKKKMEAALMGMDLPVPVRKMVPISSVRSRLGMLSGTVKKNLYLSLEEDRNEEIIDRMVSEISGQIEECLTKMAEVVEIPLGP